MTENKANFTRKSWKIIALGAFVVLLAASALLFIFRDRLFFRGPKPKVELILPTREMIEAVSKKGFRPDLQQMRMKALLIDESGTSPYILSWYLMPGQLLSMPPAQSAYIDATDQALLMRFYILRNERSAASKLSDAIMVDFSDGNGALFGARRIDQLERISDKGMAHSASPELEPKERNSGSSLEASCAYLRALLEYHARWGGAQDWERIDTLVPSIYHPDGYFICDYAVVPQNTSEWLVGLTDYETYFEERIEEGAMYLAVKLCAPDLRAFRIMADLDAQYEPMYQEAFDMIAGGYISNRLPLFALAYSKEQGDYIYFASGEAQVDAVSSIKTMLHLSEVGALPVESLAWIREQIFNIGFVYTEYDIITGAAASDTEAVEAYGMILCIAIAEGDIDLYERTLHCVQRNLATLDSSPARYMIFRRAGLHRNYTAAIDNLYVLLATSRAQGG